MVIGMAITIPVSSPINYVTHVPDRCDPTRELLSPERREFFYSSILGSFPESDKEPAEQGVPLIRA